NVEAKRSASHIFPRLGRREQQPAARFERPMDPFDEPTEGMRRNERRRDPREVERALVRQILAGLLAKLDALLQPCVGYVLPRQRERSPPDVEADPTEPLPLAGHCDRQPSYPGADVEERRVGFLEASAQAFELRQEPRQHVRETLGDLPAA